MPEPRTRTPDRAPTRAERREAQSGRSRPLQAVAVLAVAALLGGGGFVLFAGGDDRGTGGGEAGVVSADLELERGGSKSDNAGFPAELPLETQDQILDLVAGLVDTGVIEPLEQGGRAPVKRLARRFDAGAAGALTTGGATVVFERDGTKMEIDEATAVPVFFTGLSDQSGAFVLVTAGFGIELEGRTEQGKLKILRSYELTFVPEGSEWKITGYDVVAVRETADAPPTTSTATTQ